MGEKPSSCNLTVKIQPGASRSEVAGRWGEHLKIRISSRAVDDAANEELVRFLSKLLGIPRLNVKIISGQRARLKRLRITGLTPQQVESRLYKSGVDE